MADQSDGGGAETSRRSFIRSAQLLMSREGFSSELVGRRTTFDRVQCQQAPVVVLNTFRTSGEGFMSGVHGQTREIKIVLLHTVVGGFIHDFPLLQQVDFFVRFDSQCKTVRFS